MGDFTNTLGLYRPLDGEVGWGADVSANFTILDDRITGDASGVANVRDFGATGDGTTNDAVAIRAAVAAGNTAVFPPGNYVYNSATPLALGNTKGLLGIGGANNCALRFTGAAGIEFTNTGTGQRIRNMYLGTSGPDLMTSTGPDYVANIILEDLIVESTVTGAHLLTMAGIVVGFKATSCYWIVPNNQSVAPILWVSSAGPYGLNANYWYNNVFQSLGSGNLLGNHYWLEIGSGVQNVFRDSYFENSHDGYFKLTKNSYAVIDGVQSYDMGVFATHDLIVLDSDCAACSISNTGTQGDFNAGKYMIADAGYATSITNVPQKLKMTGTYTKLINSANFGSSSSGSAGVAIFQDGSVDLNAGFRVKRVAGAPTDANFPDGVGDGCLCFDTTNARLYVRHNGGVWSYFSLAGP